MRGAELVIARLHVRRQQVATRAGVGLFHIQRECLFLQPANEESEYAAHFLVHAWQRTHQTRSLDLHTYVYIYACRALYI